MTDDRTDQRAAELLPEERAAGSDDPRGQAAAILADSDRREADPESLEERRSGEIAHSPNDSDSPVNVVSRRENTR